jgi:hypothetical protein
VAEAVWVDSYRGLCHPEHEFSGKNYWAGGEAASGEGRRGLRGLRRRDMDALNSRFGDVHIRRR